MSYGPTVGYVISMASATTFSAAVDLQKAWNKISLVIPTMASGSDIYVQGQDGVSGTYRRVYHSPTTQSATIGAMSVTSGVTNCLVPFQNLHTRYLKVELSSATSDTPYTFYALCSD